MADLSLDPPDGSRVSMVKALGICKFNLNPTRKE